MNLFTINDAKSIAVIYGTDIAGQEPPVFGYSLFRGRFVAPVAFHNIRAANPELASLAGANLSGGVLIHNFGRAVGYEFANGGCVVGRNHGVDGGRFSEWD